MLYPAVPSIIGQIGYRTILLCMYTMTAPDPSFHLLLHIRIGKAERSECLKDSGYLSTKSSNSKTHMSVTLEMLAVRFYPM